jgi:hypothetical protein
MLKALDSLLNTPKPKYEGGFFEYGLLKKLRRTSSNVYVHLPFLNGTLIGRKIMKDFKFSFFYQSWEGRDPKQVIPYSILVFSNINDKIV